MAVRKSTNTPGKKSAKASKAPAKRAAPAHVAAKKALAKPAKQAKANPMPADAPLPLRSVTPHLIINGASKALAWYSKTFGAKELARNLAPDGKIMHASMQIGDSVLMLADAFMGPIPSRIVGVTLHIQRADINALWDKALANGATVEMPLADQFWGDRYGQLRDPFGHCWSFGWPVKMSPARQAQLQSDAMTMFASMK